VTEFSWIDDRNDTAVRDELDRMHPERLKLRPSNVEGFREAFTVVEEMWTPTIDRARRLSRPKLHDRVDGEYSFVETFRHLLFAWDAWLRGVLRVPDGYHEWALPPELPADAAPALTWSARGGWTSCDVAPDLEAVLAVRNDRSTRVRDYLSDATSEDLGSPGTPPPWHRQERSVLFCLHLVLSEEWWHHRFASRDLAVLERT
jgi:hypothetical protein